MIHVQVVRGKLQITKLLQKIYPLEEAKASIGTATDLTYQEDALDEMSTQTCNNQQLHAYKADSVSDSTASL